MKQLLFISITICILSLTSCVAPSMTIYGRGTSYGKDGISRGIAVKEAQIYGDLVGNTSVRGSVVSITASGGYYNSTVVRETYTGAAKIGRSWFQPLMSWLGLGAVVNNAAGVGTQVAP